MDVVHFADLTKRYGKQRGIEQLHLTVKQGEMFGFIGPNGAGKSTTLRTLMQLIHPTSGTIELFGERVDRERPDLRQRIGYLPSEVHFHDELTGLEVLDFSARVHGKRLKETPALADAERLGLDVRKRVKSYSLGNRKKLGIVQCLLHRPELIVMDEPTSGLDPLMQHTFFEMLREYNERGATVLFSTHVLSEVEKLCSRAAFIRDGRILRVSEVDRIPGKDRRIAHIRFRQPGNQIEAYHLTALDPGASFDGTEHRLTLRRPLQAALRQLSAYDIDDIRIDQPTLEQLFMAEYEGPDAAERKRAAGGEKGE
ncbi:ABC transporter ATP-binding protein [Paenibacillus melissococcoides]|uniref:ABC transporter ATP-binding protein n=1 Tax=Paenibacillus melissococcoides TaxID=2912268 RepID=A0ABN8UEV9_9BACL|nr:MULTISPECIES: ABC transporter ATP-binding protein [Paenibacillus]MEB9893948.1 ABC transporter ATP-binding protein [Bacillus cereus]CAH8248178.1 ABC transporter ATP-binding protein [Paenibacillus melissococcoides]CAH8718245.1 ABC transporter ATP-binding protein [Paenibacillus melissococcoides]CAH8718877.1 ABC transporter ATP-binding protein [Paenibacillus melissococcoides]